MNTVILGKRVDGDLAGREDVSWSKTLVCMNDMHLKFDGFVKDGPDGRRATWDAVGLCDKSCAQHPEVPPGTEIPTMVQYLLRSLDKNGHLGWWKVRRAQ